MTMISTPLHLGAPIHRENPTVADGTIHTTAIHHAVGEEAQEIDIPTAKEAISQTAETNAAEMMIAMRIVGMVAAVAAMPLTKVTDVLIAIDEIEIEIEIAIETTALLTGIETEAEIGTETAVDTTQIVTEIVIEIAIVAATGTETEIETDTTVAIGTEGGTRRRASRSTMSMILLQWDRNITKLLRPFSASWARCTSTKRSEMTNIKTDTRKGQKRAGHSHS